jgi:hypothetical protein
LWALVGGLPPAGDHYGAGLYPPEEPGPLGRPAETIDVRVHAVERRPRHLAAAVAGQLSLF